MNTCCNRRLTVAPLGDGFSLWKAKNSRSNCLDLLLLLWIEKLLYAGCYGVKLWNMNNSLLNWITVKYIALPAFFCVLDIIYNVAWALPLKIDPKHGSKLMHFLSLWSRNSCWCETKQCSSLIDTVWLDTANCKQFLYTMNCCDMAALLLLFCWD